MNNIPMSLKTVRHILVVIRAMKKAVKKETMKQEQMKKKAMKKSESHDNSHESSDDTNNDDIHDGNMTINTEMVKIEPFPLTYHRRNRHVLAALKRQGAMLST